MTSILLSGITLKKIGARLLPSIACLKRISPLSFMPLVPYPARFARHLPLEGKRDRATVDRVLSYNGALETISLALSYRHCPIRLASLATFPTRGRLCPSFILFPKYACIRYDDARIEASPYRHSAMQDLRYPQCLCLTI